MTTEMLAKATVIVERCRALALITEVPGETTRTFLSVAMRHCNERVAAWMHDAGMATRVDAMGNLRGLRQGDTDRDRRVMLASHLDTVPNAGAFDGILGVMLGIAVVEEMRGQSLPFAVEVIGFSDEEGVRYVPFLGSRALVGTVDETLLQREDELGISVRDAQVEFGLEDHAMQNALADPATFAYLEFHIEQGPVLESMNLPLGVVDTVAGQSRCEVVFHGQANHAGTTPMRLRHDALAAAAAWITLVESYARLHDDVVATVGQITVLPGMSNVVPGEARASLDVRSASDTERSLAVETLLRSAMEESEVRGVEMKVTRRVEQGSVTLNRALGDALVEAARAAGAEPLRMVSGAGHDAMIVAEKIPATMLFLRSLGGLSHHPDEAVLVEDVALALQTGVAMVQALAEKESNDAATG